MSDGPFRSRAPKMGFVAPFDGVRGFGVIIVVLEHGVDGKLAGVASIVDLFFIISGFLITTLLLEEYRGTGRLNLREFYLRRAVRLFPVLYASLALVFVAGMLVGDAAFQAQVRNDVASAGLYVYHVVHPVQYSMLTGGRPPARPLIQLWSLSVEEHFYLFGALVTLVAIKWNRARTLIVAFSGFAVFVAIARATDHVGYRMMWYQRPDAIAIGVALAFANAMLPSEFDERTKKLIGRLGVLGTAIFCGTIFTGTVLSKPFGLYVPVYAETGTTINDGFHWGNYGYSLSSAGAVLMVFSMVRGAPTLVTKVLSWKPILGVGRRSYTIYILHFPLGLLLVEATKNRSANWQTLAGLAYVPALVIGTELLHRYVELPPLNWLRNRNRRLRAQPSVEGQVRSENS